MGRGQLWVSLGTVTMTGCLVLSPSPMITKHTPLTGYEIERLKGVAALVTACTPIQGFPFEPCATGDTITATIELIRGLRIVRWQGPFTCGFEEIAVGCFNPGTWALQYDVSGKTYPAEDILDHELLHAVLWVLGDSRHWCSLHDRDGNEKWDCYE